MILICIKINLIIIKNDNYVTINFNLNKKGNLYSISNLITIKKKNLY